MTSTSYFPLVCPTCGGILQLTATLYSCSLHHRYTGHQLDATLAEQVRQTLRRTIQQLKQSQYLLELMAKRGLPTALLNGMDMLQQAHRLSEQLLNKVSQSSQ